MSTYAWISTTLAVKLSAQSLALLKELAARGIYGETAGEVAGRFVDKALEQFVAMPKLGADVSAPARRKKRVRR